MPFHNTTTTSPTTLAPTQLQAPSRLEPPTHHPHRASPKQYSVGVDGQVNHCLMVTQELGLPRLSPKLVKLALLQGFLITTTTKPYPADSPSYPLDTIPPKQPQSVDFSPASRLHWVLTPLSCPHPPNVSRNHSSTTPKCSNLQRNSKSITFYRRLIRVPIRW